MRPIFFQFLDFFFGQMYIFGGPDYMLTKKCDTMPISISVSFGNQFLGRFFCRFFVNFLAYDGALIVGLGICCGICLVFVDGAGEFFCFFCEFLGVNLCGFLSNFSDFWDFCWIFR